MTTTLTGWEAALGPFYAPAGPTASGDCVPGLQEPGNPAYGTRACPGSLPQEMHFLRKWRNGIKGSHSDCEGSGLLWPDPDRSAMSYAHCAITGGARAPGDDYLKEPWARYVPRVTLSS